VEEVSTAIAEENTEHIDSLEGATGRVQGILSPELLAKLADPTQWKLRLEGVTALAEMLSAMDEATQATQLAPIFSFVQHKPSFSDSNFQVLQKLFATLTALANSSKAFTRRMAAISVVGTPYFISKSHF
jgi:hypothetical protein